MPTSSRFRPRWGTTRSTRPPRRRARQADQVLVLEVGRDDLLRLPHRVQRLDLVAQDSRPLVLLLRGGGLHLPGEPPGQVILPALEEGLDVLDRPAVALARLPAGARGLAAVDVVLEARPLGPAVDLDGAGPQREELADQAEGLAKGRRREEGAVVGGPVLGDPPGDDQAGELLVGRELEERVVFVVPEDDDVLEVGDLVDEGVGLGVARPRGLEIRTNPSL